MRPAVLALGALLATACANPLSSARTDAARALADRNAARASLEAERERVRVLEGELQRLRADLAQAESVLVSMESGLKGSHTRASGVSALAEARILVDRAARAAPRRRGEIAEARAKLDEADSQLRDGHAGSAVFFASRARRIAESLLRDAEPEDAGSGARIGAARANLRSRPSATGSIVEVLEPRTPVAPRRRKGVWVEVSTPSGRTGWVHESLLR
jgi:chromosome segregation ATPase